MNVTVIRERKMQTARGETAWIEAGKGWPVILLHAFPFSADIWRAQLERVPAGWRFIAPDLRGFGQSPLPAGERRATVDDYAADVFALMDGLAIDDAVIGGLSMGGYVTFAMFRQAPMRFTGMVLADTKAGADTPQAREGRVALRKTLAVEGPAGVATEMLPRLLSANADPDVVSRARAWIEAQSADAIDIALRALMDRPDSTPDLPRIACAALVVVGEEDVVTPLADAEAMQRVLRRSTLSVIPAAGHLANLEQPQAFSLALVDFLRSAL